MYKGEDFFIIKKTTYPKYVFFHVLGLVGGRTVHIHVNSPESIHYYEKTDRYNPKVRMVVDFLKLFLDSDIKWSEERGTFF